MTYPTGPADSDSPEPGTASEAPGPPLGELPQRIQSDPDSVQRDLMRLVLTLIELIRQLMERQAIRRVDQEDLSEQQVEDLGMALMRLEEAMRELRDRFDLTPEDLNIDLGPLGPLLPRQP